MRPTRRLCYERHPLGMDQAPGHLDERNDRTGSQIMDASEALSTREILAKVRDLLNAYFASEGAEQAADNPPVNPHGPFPPTPPADDPMRRPGMDRALHFPDLHRIPDACRYGERVRGERSVAVDAALLRAFPDFDRIN